MIYEFSFFYYLLFTIIIKIIKKKKKMVLKNLFAFGEFDYEIKYSIKKKNCYKKIEKTSMVYKYEKVNNYQTTLK